MAKVKNIRQMTNYMMRVRNVYLAAHIDTLLRVTNEALAETIKNEKKQFTGRNERRLTGNLMRSTTAEFSGDFRTVKNITRLPRGFIVVKTPYAAIHEHGGEIRPKKAKNLWIKLAHSGKFKRMTPTDFFNARKRASLREIAQSRLLSKGLTAPSARGSKVRRQMVLEQFEIIPGQRPKSRIAAHIVRTKRGLKVTPLFALAKRVKMPSRPYVGPAIKRALMLYGVKYARSLAGLVSKRFIGNKG